MDVLSDVIAVMRTGRPTSARVAWRAPWAQRFEPVAGAAGFQVVLDGACWLTPDADAKPIRLAAGDVVFLPHGRGFTLADHPSTPLTGPPCHPDAPRPSRYSREPPRGGGLATVTLCGAYRLDPARAHPLLRQLPEVVHLPGHVAPRSSLRATVDLLADELARPRLGTDAIIPALLDTLLLQILRTWLEEPAVAGRPDGWAAALADPVTAAALAAVHRDPARQWTVASLAAEAGLSRAPFARRFTARVGRPPLAYLTWWRMTTAARLLRESDAPLGVVAARVGYASQFAFAAAFKRHFGVPPGRFRRV